MKKIGLAVLLLLAVQSQYASAATTAPRNIDQEMQDVGAINSDYVVINENIYRAYMQYLNADMQAFLHRKGQPAQDPFNQIGFDENGLFIKAKIKEIKGTRVGEAEAASMRKEMKKSLCNAFITESQVLKKRNWNLRGEIYNVRGQQVFLVNLKLQDCPQ